jgi:hypothetical protein
LDAALVSYIWNVTALLGIGFCLLLFCLSSKAEAWRRGADGNGRHGDAALSTSRMPQLHLKILNFKICLKFIKFFKKILNRLKFG